MAPHLINRFRRLPILLGGSSIFILTAAISFRTSTRMCPGEFIDMRPSHGLPFMVEDSTGTTFPQVWPHLLRLFLRLYMFLRAALMPIIRDIVFLMEIGGSLAPFRILVRLLWSEAM